jgi:hypothetical protein
MPYADDTYTLLVTLLTTILPDESAGILASIDPLLKLTTRKKLEAG